MIRSLPLLVFSGVLLASKASADPTKQQCISANEGGQDLRRTGKLREAAERFQFCSAASCPRVLREDCVTRLNDVRHSLPTVVFTAKDRRGQVVAGVKVSMDGAPLAGRLDGSAIEVEPGAHSFDFVAEGFLPASKKLVLREGVKGREEVVVLEPVASAEPERIGPRAGDDALPASPAEGTNTKMPAPTGGGAWGTVGYAVGAGGLVGLVIGTAFGVAARVTYDNATEKCDAERGGVRLCDGDAVDAGATARTYATVSTVAFAIGAPLLVGGIVLHFIAPRERTVSVAFTGTGLLAQGRW